jgi:hypothetical protein
MGGVIKYFNVSMSYDKWQGSFLLKNQKFMKSPTTALCITSNFEKQIPHLTKQLHQIRKDKRLHSIHCILRLTRFHNTTRQTSFVDKAVITANNV